MHVCTYVRTLNTTHKFVSAAHVQIYIERAGNTGWVDGPGVPVFSADGSQILLIRPVRDSENGHFPQLVQGEAVSPQLSSTPNLNGNALLKEPVSLTHGTFEVTEIIGWDEKNHFVYVKSACLSLVAFLCFSKKKSSRPSQLLCVHSTGLTRGTPSVSCGRSLPPRSGR